MATWISDVDRIEAEMVAAKVPPKEAMRVAALFANAMAQREKAERDAAAKLVQQERTAKLCREIGATEAARELGISARTARWRRGEYLKVGNGVV